MSSDDEYDPGTPVNASWIWSGNHGASGGIVHPFFAIRDDPDRRYAGVGNYLSLGNGWATDGTILAGSGGLLLIKWSPLEDELYDPLELDPEEAYEAQNRSQDSLEEGDDEELFKEREFNEEVRRLGHLYGIMRLDDEEADDQSDNTSELNQHWQELIVVNPSTEGFWVLPPANARDVGLEFWSYDGVQANLLVDREAQTYTVTLTCPDFVCLYSSTGDAWRCRRFNQRASWGRLHNEELLEDPWEMQQIASAYVGGRLFFADVVVEDSIPTMNLIEIDAEAGSWKLHDWHYSLQTEFTEFLDTPFLRMRGLTDHDQGMRQALPTGTRASRRNGRALENFQIVECLGELYAVIPMGLNEYLPMSLRGRRTLTEVVSEYGNFGLSFMPLQFLIVSMRGDGFVHGVLRIVLPKDLHSIVGQETVFDNTENRKRKLMDMLGINRNPEDEIRWEFSCVAEGSVIWVALLDYVLQYDVVTGMSKTEITEEGSPLEIWVDRAPYRPSDMEPS